MRTKPLLVVLTLFSLVSCGDSVTLVTDEVFRQSAPEIVESWSALFPIHNAQRVDLPPGNEIERLEGVLRTTPGRYLIGVSTDEPTRSRLVVTFPGSVLKFFVSGESGSGNVVFLRGEAWNLVARTAARPGPAVAFFPRDATSDELMSFRQSWTQAGGGTLKTGVGYQPQLLTPVPEQVFSWEEELGPAMVTLPPSVSVHGNPGLARAQGASGLTWALKTGDFGSFLWAAAVDPSTDAHFLPLETVFVRR